MEDFTRERSLFLLFFKVFWLDRLDKGVELLDIILVQNMVLFDDERVRFQMCIRDSPFAGSYCVLFLMARCIGFTRSHTAFHRRTRCATSVFFLFKGILSRKSSSLPFWCLPLLQAIDSRFTTEEHRSMAAENRAP